MNLRDIIDKERERQDLSVNALAKKSGVNQSTLHRFLAGERDLTQEYVGKLLAALGLEVKRKPKAR